MSVEPMDLGELLVNLQAYYNAGRYDAVDMEAWSDEFGKRTPLFLGCLFLAIRKSFSKTFKMLPDVAIATKALADAHAIHDNACLEQQQKVRQIGDGSDYVSDAEREEVATQIHSLLERLVGKARFVDSK